MVVVQQPQLHQNRSNQHHRPGHQPWSQCRQPHLLLFLPLRPPLPHVLLARWPMLRGVEEGVCPLVAPLNLQTDRHLLRMVSVLVLVLNWPPTPPGAKSSTTRAFPQRWRLCAPTLPSQARVQKHCSVVGRHQKRSPRQTVCYRLLAHHHLQIHPTRPRWALQRRGHQRQWARHAVGAQCLGEAMANLWASQAPQKDLRHCCFVVGLPGAHEECRGATWCWRGLLQSVALRLRRQQQTHTMEVHHSDQREPDARQQERPT